MRREEGKFCDLLRLLKKERERMRIKKEKGKEEKRITFCVINCVHQD